MGGVASYYKVLKDRFTKDVEYFTVDSRTNNDSIWYVLVRFLKDNWKFYQKLKKGNYDIIHLNPSLDFKAIFRDGIFLLNAKRFKVKVVVFIHGWKKSFERKIKSSQLFKYIYFKSDAFIVLSYEFKDKLSQMGYKKKIYVETTAVDDDLLLGFDINLIIKKIEKIKSDFNILFLARIEKAKGIYEAIDTYKILKNKFQFVNMTIAGNGSEFIKVQGYVKKNKIHDIQFVGYVQGELKKKVFLSSDIYFFPTYGEGMPSSVLEAMAFGLPVVTRPVGGLKDFFVNGKMGFITKSKDPEVLTELIEKLIIDQELRNNISKYNCNYAKEHFLASKVAKRVENIYKEVISNKNWNAAS